MNIERLTRLRDLLRADAANPKGVKFDLSWWASPMQKGHVDVNNRDFPTVNGKIVTPPTMSCDTFACALGLACLDPSFQKEGLHFIQVPYRSSTDVRMIPEFNGKQDFRAGAEFFGISENDSSYLFDPEHYEETPREAEGELFVAQRVDDLINGKVDYNCYPTFEED